MKVTCRPKYGALKYWGAKYWGAKYGGEGHLQRVDRGAGYGRDQRSTHVGVVAPAAKHSPARSSRACTYHQPRSAAENRRQRCATPEAASVFPLALTRISASRPASGGHSFAGPSFTGGRSHCQPAAGYSADMLFHVCQSSNQS